MAKISTKEAQTGMVLAADVHDSNGRFLVGKGCEITDKHIRSLMAWGVNTIDIEGDEPEAPPATIDVPGELLAQFRADVEQRFGYSNTGHPFIKALMEKSIQHLARRYHEQGASDGS